MKNIIFLVFILLSTNLFAVDLYTTEDVNLVNEKDVNLAIITKGTKIKVLKKNGDKSLIVVQGWSYEEEPNVEIFYEVGITVALAKLEEISLKNRNVLSKKEDEYEDLWLENKISGWIPSSKISGDFNSLWIKEASFASQRCGTCHGEPKIEAYDAVQFPSLVNLMKSQSGISDEEEKFIVNYYQKNKIYGKK